jgi:hypothetical protein
MPLWGNTDAANSEPIWPELKEVIKVAELVTANATTAGKAIKFTAAANTITAANTGIGVGTYVYSAEVANSVSRGLDGSIINNEITFFRSNNTVASVDVANSVIVLANNFVGTAIANGAIVYFGNVMLQTALTQANTYGRDTILVTDSRLANANTTLANVGSVSTGWVHVYKKTNADGTIRFLKETLVCLSNAAASNAQSANTATGGQIFSGV